MTDQFKADFHKLAAAREENAAAKAVSEPVARLHAALSQMHRHEAERIDSGHRVTAQVFES